MSGNPTTNHGWSGNHVRVAGSQRTFKAGFYKRGISLLRRREKNASVQGEADASEASRLNHCNLYGVVLDNAWNGAGSTAKRASETLQHGQAKTHGRQADYRRHRFFSRPEHLLRNGEP